MPHHNLLPILTFMYWGNGHITEEDEGSTDI
jgi:hypothetical protein